MEVLFWTIVIILGWVYIGYPVSIFVLSKLFKKKETEKEESELPNLTVVIAVYNEEETICKRIDNCFNSNYPQEKIRILVASDGSKDSTVKKVTEYGDSRVTVLDFAQNRGKALVHNDCIEHINDEIIVFTDAETIFDENFLREIVKPFALNHIGGVVGKLVYSKSDKEIAKAEGVYFRYESHIRQWESDLRILAFGSGACMAMRKSLFRKLTPIDDTDFTSLQDIIIQNKTVVFNKKAIAYDFAPSTIKGEYKSRVRITAKNLVGTIRRWKVKNIFIHPFVTFGIISHRILRWFTPYLLVVVLAVNIYLVNYSLIMKAVLILQIIFLILVVIGFITRDAKIKVPLCGLALSFFVANVGMFIGVLRGIFGLAPSFYIQKN